MSMDRLREIVDAATPGPWEQDAREGLGRYVFTPNPHVYGEQAKPAADVGWDVAETLSNHEPDAAFIATFDPQVVGALLNVRDVLRAIADRDWEGLLARTDSIEPASEFETVGDYETDARHVYPARERLIVDVARAALDALSEVTP